MPVQERALSVDGADPRSGVALDDVLDAVAGFVANPHATASVDLTVTVDDARRSLRAEMVDGALRVVTVADHTRVAQRLGGDPVSFDELVWLFSAFYPEGKRLARYAWIPPR